MPGQAPSSPFPVRALIEGFYGVYYTHPERQDLISFLARHGFNGYIYAPKNDRQHRSRWREPYPDLLMQQFAETVQHSRSLGIDFCYSLAPGIDVSYSSERDFSLIVEKFSAFLAIGVRSFGLLLDDIRRDFSDPADAAHFHSFADAQANLCNRVFDWLRAQDESCTLVMCPTEYHGEPPFHPSLTRLGELLHPDIDVCYTGNEVCSATIGRSEVDAFAAQLGRPPVIWDNYPVNDLAMHGELHIGPIRGRSAALAGAVRGFAVNPMNQAEASRVPLATFAEYFADPHGYEPERAWRRAIEEVAGERADDLESVARMSLQSCLGTPEAEELQSLCRGAMAAITSGHSDQPVVDELHDFLADLDNACYALRYRIGNLALRNELLPWLEQLESWTWLGRWSIEALRLTMRGQQPEASLVGRIAEYLQAVDRHHKRIAGDFLRPIALAALQAAATHGERMPATSEEQRTGAAEEPEVADRTGQPA